MIISFRFKVRICLINLVFILTALVSGCGDGSDHLPEGGDSTVLVSGAPMVGGANGLFFDRDNMLYVANVFGQTISRIDPESGEVVERLGRDQGIDASADDLAIDAFGTLYWTDIIRGLVKGRTSGEAVFTVAQGFPSVNPITVGDDGRLFFAQCFAGGSNGIYEADPAGVMEPRTIRDGDIDCASNGMDWWDGVLYAPRWFEGRVVAMDIDSGELTDITTGWGAPAAVKFNSKAL